MSQSRMAVITFLDGPTDPGFGQLPGYGGGYPGNALPGYGRPDNSLPGYGHPGNALPGGGHISLLPVFPFDPTLSPDNELPDSGGSPDNTFRVRVKSM